MVQLKHTWNFPIINNIGSTVRVVQTDGFHQGVGSGVAPLQSFNLASIACRKICQGDTGRNRQRKFLKNTGGEAVGCLGMIYFINGRCFNFWVLWPGRALMFWM